MTRNKPLTVTQYTPEEHAGTAEQLLSKMTVAELCGCAMDCTSFQSVPPATMFDVLRAIPVDRFLSIVPDEHRQTVLDQLAIDLTCAVFCEVVPDEEWDNEDNTHEAVINL